MENRQDSENQTKPQVEPVNPAEPLEDETEQTGEEQRPKGIAAVFREAFDRARYGQRRGSAPRRNSNPQVSDRTARNRDRTKILFVSVVGLVAVLVIFLGVFSSSHSPEKREPAARRNPSLGRPEDQGRRAGSVTPLLSAETNGQNPGNGQVTPDDITNTSRPRGTGEMATSDQGALASPHRARPQAAGANQTLNDVQFTDPALEVVQLFRTARKRNSSVWGISQTLEDFVGTDYQPKPHGPGIGCATEQQRQWRAHLWD